MVFGLGRERDGSGPLNWGGADVRVGSTKADFEHRLLDLRSSPSTSAIHRGDAHVSFVTLPEVKRTGSPVKKRTPKWRAPKRHAIACACVREFGLRTASSHLDAALRLAAHEHHEIRAFAGLGAQRLVGDDKGRSRRHPGGTIQGVLWNDNPVERALCTAGVRRHRLDGATLAPPRAALWLRYAPPPTPAPPCQHPP